MISLLILLMRRNRGTVVQWLGMVVRAVVVLDRCWLLLPVLAAIPRLVVSGPVTLLLLLVVVGLH